MALHDDLAYRLWRDGYRALATERAAADGGDTFAGRLLGRRAVVTRGRAGAQLFYDTDLIERRRAVPAALADLLFGHGAVHGLDGDAHRRRKAMFLQILDEKSVADLVHRVGEGLRARLAAARGREVTLFDELVETYGVAVLAWAGIACPQGQAQQVAHRLAAIVDGFGLAGSAYPRGWGARLQANAWARRMIGEVRAGSRVPTPGTPLHRLSAAGALEVKVAAVELLNILRPTVAVAWPGTFAGLALSEHPQWRALLRDGDDRETVEAHRVAFGHEVRRLFPFVPALAGRLRRRAELDGVPLAPGDRLVLDVVGTDQHPDLWHDPAQFRPERFAGVMPDPFGFLPQGGGDPRTGHRCPGEPLTVRILAETLGVLAETEYDVVSAPSYDLGRIPTLPDRGLLLRLR